VVVGFSVPEAGPDWVAEKNYNYKIQLFYFILCLKHLIFN
jgi:hypothetical protein